MCCNTERNSDSMKYVGLVGNHAYSLLAAYSFKTPRGDQKILNIRNPYGDIDYQTLEWKGAWSDGSKEWT